MRMTEKECYLYLIESFNKWAKFEINELEQVWQIVIKSKKIKKSHLKAIDKQFRISLSGLKICKSKEEETTPQDKNVYVINLKKFDSWEQLTLKELKQVGDIIGNNWKLKEEAMEVLGKYCKEKPSHLKRIK